MSFPQAKCLSMSLLMKKSVPLRLRLKLMSSDSFLPQIPWVFPVEGLTVAFGRNQQEIVPRGRSGRSPTLKNCDEPLNERALPMIPLAASTLPLSIPLKA